jgi:hypothetical protein
MRVLSIRALLIEISICFVMDDEKAALRLAGLEQNKTYQAASKRGALRCSGVGTAL